MRGKPTRFSRRICGRAVRRAREQFGLSQEDFAEQAGVHRTYASSIELGKVSVGIDVANSAMFQVLVATKVTAPPGISVIAVRHSGMNLNERTMSSTC